MRPRDQTLRGSSVEPNRESQVVFGLQNGLEPRPKPTTNEGRLFTARRFFTTTCCLFRFASRFPRGLATRRFLWNFLPLLTGFRKSDSDRLLPALYFSAFATFAFLQRAAFFLLHRGLYVLAGGFRVLAFCHRNSFL